MRYRKDILRGVRLAAAAFAVLLLALISYRMLHGAPTEASRKAAPPAVVRPEPSPKPLAVHVSAADSDVPAPPGTPAVSHSARVHKPRVASQQAAPALPAPVIINADVEPAPQPANPAPVNEIAAAPVLPGYSALEVPSAAPEAPQDVPQKPENRKRGVLRSVGRFLHIVKRDPTQSSAVLP